MKKCEGIRLDSADTTGNIRLKADGKASDIGLIA